MKHLEVHLTPERFEALHSGLQSALYADMSIATKAGNHVVVQEYRSKNGAFTGRWLRFSVTHVERTTDHRQVLSLREIARSKPVRTITKRAA